MDVVLVDHLAELVVAARALGWKLDPPERGADNVPPWSLQDGVLALHLAAGDALAGWRTSHSESGGDPTPAPLLDTAVRPAGVPCLATETEVLVAPALLVSLPADDARAGGRGWSAPPRDWELRVSLEVRDSVWSDVPCRPELAAVDAMPVRVHVGPVLQRTTAGSHTVAFSVADRPLQRTTVDLSPSALEHVVRDLVNTLAGRSRVLEPTHVVLLAGIVTDHRLMPSSGDCTATIGDLSVTFHIAT